MIVGDGEDALNEYLDLAHDTLGQPRRAHLRQAAEIPGVYVPALHDRSGDVSPMPPRKIADLAQWPAYSTVLTDETEFSGSLLIEITRGCPFKCRFCTVGYVYPKFRQLPGETVLDIVTAQQRRDRDNGLPPVGKVGLISSATGDYRALPMVAQGLVDMGVAIGISSLRMDRMPDVLIDCMVRSGVRSCTVAPEAGSERLRQLIRKEMSEAVILEGAERLLAHGMRDLKLYSMIGLPTETDDDVQELLSLVFKIWALMKRYGRPRGALGTLTLSVNPFIPNPPRPCNGAPWLPSVRSRRSFTPCAKPCAANRPSASTTAASRTTTSKPFSPAAAANSAPSSSKRTGNAATGPAPPRLSALTPSTGSANRCLVKPSCPGIFWKPTVNASACTVNTIVRWLCRSRRGTAVLAGKDGPADVNSCGFLQNWLAGRKPAGRVFVNYPVSYFRIHSRSASSIRVCHPRPSALK